MGRGRQKAKQTKVARALKYNPPATDLDRLRQELGATAPGSVLGSPPDDTYDDYSDYGTDSEEDSDPAPAPDDEDDDEGGLGNEVRASRWG